jgi:hypothetical protein
MSIINVNQIKARITETYRDCLDMSDVHQQGENFDNFFLTRGLSAFAIQNLAQTTPQNATDSVTDSGNDHGIDAVFFDERERSLYIVQSKWIKNGNGEPELGDILKFVEGIKDLFDLSFERFNTKINAKKEMLQNAINDPQSKFVLVIAYTGIQELSNPSKRSLDDLLHEMNDNDELLRLEILNQTKLYKFLISGLSGDPINETIFLRSWGKMETPYKAVYGHVAAAEIVSLWQKYHNRLFIHNLRDILGDTEVNAEIRNTIEKNPTCFWYYNNGITALVTKYQKAAHGGGTTDLGIFQCENFTIVNGAQTVGTIGKYGEGNPTVALDSVFIPIRIISQEGAPEFFGETVTKTNNRQNKIDNRDFVTLDPVQDRIKIELAVDGILYQVMRSESIIRGDRVLDLIDATTALACASKKVNLVVQLKREIGKLWEDITKAPYKELFNQSTPSIYVWNCVRTQRKIDASFDILKKTLGGRDYQIVVHGNRLISSLIFNAIDSERLKDPAFAFDIVITDEIISAHVQNYFRRMKGEVEESFPTAIIQPLFKNLSKCKEIHKKLSLL